MIIWLKKSPATLSNKISKVKLKSIMTHSHMFSCATSSDWFIGLSASVVIGQSNYFGFALMTLDVKLLLRFTKNAISLVRMQVYFRGEQALK